MIPSLILAAALACSTAQGHRLELAGQKEAPPDMVVGAARRFGYVPLVLRMDEKPGYWVKVLLSADTAFVWPRGQGLVLTLADSSRIVATDVLVQPPPPMCRQVFRLGIESFLVQPDQLQKQRGGRAVMLYARFDHPKTEPIGLSTSQPGRR